jgi:hypothetical protein
VLGARSPSLRSAVSHLIRACRLAIGTWTQLIGRFRKSRTCAFDPYQPVGLLQSCPMLSAGFLSFASTKRSFVTSGSRPFAATHGGSVNDSTRVNAGARSYATPR